MNDQCRANGKLIVKRLKKKKKALQTEAQAEVLTHTLLCDQHIPADKERLLLYAAPFTTTLWLLSRAH